MTHFPLEVFNIACKDLMSLKNLNSLAEDIGLSAHVQLLSESKKYYLFFHSI